MNLHNRITKDKQLTVQASLHIFLMIRSADGEWHSIVCSNLSHAVRVWKSRKDTERDTGILHIGFERPLFRHFDNLVNRYLGRMLITTAAKYTLPASFVVSRKPIACTGNFTVYLGLEGWGYSLKDIKTKADDTPKKLQDWIVSYLKENPHAAKILSAHKIYDDTSYLNAEHGLEPITRLQLGMFRYHYLVGANCKDPCELARAAPPWLAKRKLTSLNITSRAYKIFARNNLVTVADLATWTSERLLKEPLVGYKSLYNILERLKIALSDAPISDTTQIPNIYPGNKATQSAEIYSNFNFNLIENIKCFLLSLNERERYVLKRYLGFETPPLSIRQIADNCDTKPPNLRYLAGSSIQKLKQNLFWYTFIQKITRLLNDKLAPLSINRVEAMDSWFKGISEQQIFLVNLVRVMNKNDINIIDVNGTFYFSTIDQPAWDSIVEKAKKTLATGTNKKWSETEACLIVQNLLPDTAKEFAHILWHHASLLCHFKTNPDGERILTGYGKSINSIIKTILCESDVPLHYSRITELANLRQERKLEKLKVRAMACGVALVFKAGTYGLAKHILLSEEQMNSVRREAESIVCAENTKKQWHAFEILSALPEQITDTHKVLDKYLLNIILAKSKVLKYLGKMAWVDTQRHNDDKIRINNVQAIINILEEAGHPLRTSEIKERLAAVKGINKFFCIPLTDPLIRTKPGTWGINDRDVPISRKQQRTLIEKLVKKLNQRQTAIHLHEIPDSLPLQNCSPYTFLTIAAQDERLRVSSSKYVYLDEWKELRVD